MITPSMFYSALKSLPNFIESNNASWAEVYDYMESMCGDLKDYHWEEVAQVYRQFMTDSRY
ncbi:hypothetical protein RW110999_075 [Cyanophage S-RIM4]|nr:hypothetical protein RW110999_075 [Cyanophage S-RIM4]